LLGDGGATFDDFRKGAGFFVEQWLFEGRRQEIASQLWAADSFHAVSQVAGAVEELAVARAAKDGTNLTASCVFRSFSSLRRDGIRKDGKPWGKGLVGTWGGECTYNGARTLTNAVLVACAETSGVSIALNADQKRLLGLNASTGFKEHNRDVARLMQAQNLIASMPIAGFAYVGTLKKGDNLKVALPESVGKPEFRGITIRLCTDQGCSDIVRLDGNGKLLTGRPPKGDDLAARSALAPKIVAELAGG